MELNVFPITKEPKPPYDITPEDNMIRSKSEDGYEIVRPRYTRVRNIIKLTWECGNGDYNAVKAFYDANASIPFNLSFMTTSGNTAEDAGISFSFTVRFSETPKYKYTGIGAWEITCSFREV